MGGSLASGATTLSDSLDVAGITTLNNALNVNGEVTIDAEMVSLVNATSLLVDGGIQVNDLLAAHGDLGVLGATTLSNTLGVMGATTLSSTLSVLGTTTLESTLGVTGTVTTPQVTGLSDPSGPTDAVNLGFVTLAINNATQGGAVRAVAVANVTLATLADGSVVDGVTLATGDRVLLAGQTNAVQNGVYVLGATGPPVRASNLPTGGHAAALTMVVKEGTLYGDRTFLCVTDSAADVVDTDPLTFTYVAQTLLQAAGGAAASTTALRHDDALAALAVRTDNVTVEIDGATNDLRLKDLGITNAKVADATLANAKLVHPNVTVSTGRGLLGGQLIDLGAATTLTPDFTVVPDLAATNTFAAANTFQGAVHVTATTASTSQTSGGLVVDGGLGVAGDLYVSNTYNMSDEYLKTNRRVIDNALEVVEQMSGQIFTWRPDVAQNQTVGRVGETVGVIAQEVVKAGAELCVTETSDTVMMDDGTERSLLAVDYPKLVPYLIESVKTLSAEVRTLKRRCEDLENLPVAKRVAK